MPAPRPPYRPLQRNPPAPPPPVAVQAQGQLARLVPGLPRRAPHGAQPLPVPRRRRCCHCWGACRLQLPASPLPPDARVPSLPCLPFSCRSAPAATATPILTTRSTWIVVVCAPSAPMTTSRAATAAPTAPALVSSASMVTTCSVASASSRCTELPLPQATVGLHDPPMNARLASADARLDPPAQAAASALRSTLCCPCNGGCLALRATYSLNTACSKHTEGGNGGSRIK